MMAYPQTGNPGQQQRAGVGGSGPPPPPPQSGSSRTTWILIAGAVVVGMVLLVGMIVMLVAVAGIAGGGDGALSSTGEQVGVITVEGVITASGGQSMFGAPLGGVRQTLDQLKRAEDNDSIKSVVLRINSPGGSAAASQELYHAIRQLADAKPVVASMADAAASGGYYIALPAERIIANPATMTGSIGVRMSFLHYYELMDELGVDGGSITSGPYKDIGSPWREMTDSERELLQGMITNIYDQFINDVAESRGMEVDEVRTLADGRIFTGEQAMNAGLIDETGGFNDAVRIAGELGGIEGEPQVRDMGRRGGLFDLLGMQTKAIAREAARDAVTDVLRDIRVEDAEQLLQMRR